jgi:hypothetical protein
MVRMFKWIRSDLTIKNSELNCTSCNSLACWDTHRSLAEQQNNNVNNSRHSQFADRHLSCRLENHESREVSYTATLVGGGGVYTLPDSSRQITERIIAKVLKKSTVFYGKGKFITVFSKHSYLLLSWATWTYRFHLHVGQLRTLYSSSFRTNWIHPSLHTCCMPCPFYPPCPSHPKIIRRTVQIKNLLSMQFHLP